jgi:hypothetical protein
MVLDETGIMKNLQNQDINNPKAIFGTGLFWDTEEIDLIKNADFIIARVLDFGDQKDLKKLRDLYQDDKLVEVIRSKRDLHPMTRRFWSVYFNLSRQDQADV